MQLDIQTISDRLRHWLVLSICFSILSYFVVQSFIGDNGMFRATSLEQEISQTKLELSSIQKKREKLETRTKLLKNDNMDLDMLDERARVQLGYTKPNEYVIFFKD